MAPCDYLIFFVWFYEFNLHAFAEIASLVTHDFSNLLLHGRRKFQIVEMAPLYNFYHRLMKFQLIKFQINT